MDDKYTDKQVCDILCDNHFSNLLQYILHMFGTMPRSMTEEEIIQYLKMNKNIGIVFKFMPEDVKKWCKDHDCNDDSVPFQTFTYNNQWEYIKHWNHRVTDLFDRVICLPEDYKYENPEQIKEFDKIKFLRKDINMTEQEIVLYLKENKTSGIAVGFLPEEVREFVYITPISIFRFFDGKEWIKSEKPFIRDNDIICLPDNFELKQESKDGWVDFEVDENGCYRILDTDMRFHWSEWNKPLWIYGKDENRSWYLTDFGGWQYEDSKRWYLAPAVKLKDGKMWNSYIIEESGEATPVIPVKIRFWKEYK